MSHRLLIASLLTLQGLTYSVAESLTFLPSQATTSTSSRVCGTRWLRAERAAGRMLLPETTGSAAKAAQASPIEVGTELSFPVVGGFVEATCQRVGEHAYVFVEDRHWDTNGGSILQSHVDALGDLFDFSSPADSTRGVYELELDAFGDAPDVDGDERIFLLVMDIRLAGVVGYFDARIAGHDVPEFRRDMLFLDETFVRRESYLARGTLAHEFQHLIHWNHDQDEEIWVDEGLSGYAEEVVGFPDADPNSVAEFLRQSHTSLTDLPVRIEARSYGATYLFMSFLSQRYGVGLIRDVVAHARNGTAGIDAALAARGESDRFLDVWRDWIVGNYASEDARFAYDAIKDRRVETFTVEAEDLPLQGAPGAVSGRFGTTNILFRTPGDVLVDFDGDDDVQYEVWTYTMRSSSATLGRLDLDSDNRGSAQLVGIDSAVVIIGRTSMQGQNFQLSARAFTPTLVHLEGAASNLGQASLVAAYPNPFNSSVRIPYSLATETSVELIVYDLLGQKIRRLVHGRQAAGAYEAGWDGLDGAGLEMASGVYLARLQVDGIRHVTILSLVR